MQVTSCCQLVQLCDRLVRDDIACVERCGRLEEHALHLTLRDRGAVLHQSGNNDKLTGADLHIAVPKLHDHCALRHQEELVLVVVVTATQQDKQEG